MGKNWSWSENAKQEKKDKMKKLWATKEYREKMKKIIANRNPEPAATASSEYLKKRWKTDTEYAEKMKQAQRRMWSEKSEEKLKEMINNQQVAKAASRVRKLEKKERKRKLGERLRPGRALIRLREALAETAAKELGIDKLTKADKAYLLYWYRLNEERYKISEKEND